MSKWMDMLGELIGDRSAAVSPQASIPSSSGYQGGQLYEWMMGANASAAGYPVSERSAMSVSAVYACVSLIAGAIASLPLPIYRRSDEGREKVSMMADSRFANYWWLLNEQPHRQWSAAVFWEYLIASLLLCGDAMARIVRVREGGEIVGLEPVHPSCVTVKDHELDGGLLYLVSEGGKTVGYAQDDFLHIPGIGFDGYRGMSSIRYAAKNAIGTALAAEDYSGKFFSNGARPDLLITIPQNMSKEQQELFRESWMARFGGAGKSHIPAILTGGGDIKPISMNAQDSQIIETRKFQVIDIARIFGVPPFMIGETEKSSSWGTGVESMSIGFVKYTLQRHLTKIEQELNRKIFPKSLRLFTEFTTAGLERGDIKTRYEAHRIALGRAGEPGWKTVNEIRKIENDSPIVGGDELNKGNANAAIPAASGL
jgi:HK97 family phage portal protein